jgi:hypothetical protein
VPVEDAQDRAPAGAKPGKRHRPSGAGSSGHGVIVPRGPRPGQSEVDRCRATTPTRSASRGRRWAPNGVLRLIRRPSDPGGLGSATAGTPVPRDARDLSRLSAHPPSQVVRSPPPSDAGCCRPELRRALRRCQEPLNVRSGITGSWHMSRRGKPRVYIAVAKQIGHDVQGHRCRLSSKVAPEGLEPPIRGLGSLRSSALCPQFALPARIAGVIVCG